MMKHELEDTLKRHGCYTKWPRIRSESLVLRCTISPTDPKAFKKLEDWAKKCETFVRGRLDKVKYIKEDVLQEIWKPLRSKVENSFKFSTEEMLIHWDDAGGVVHATGLQDKVTEFQKLLQKVKSELEQELERSRRQISEKFMLKPHQMALLKTTDVGKVSEKKQVSLQMTDSEIVLVGQSKEVSDVKLEILQRASSTTCSSFQCKSQAEQRLFAKPQVVQQFQDLFTKRNLRVVLVTYNDEVTIHGFAAADIDSALSLTKQAVGETAVSLHRKSVGFFRSRPWNQFFEECSREFLLADISVSDCTVNIVAINQLESSIAQKVNTFFKENVEVKDFFRMRAAIAKLLGNFEIDKVKKITVQLSSFKADIEFQGDEGCHIKIILGGLEKAKSLVKALVDQVKMKTHSVMQSSHVKHLQSTTGRALVDSIASKFRVVVNYPEDEAAQTAAAKASRSFDPQVFSQVDIRRGKLVRLVVGDISKYPADVIVNAANSGLRHGAGVAGAIASAGGETLKLECADYIRKNGDLSPGKVFVSSVGDLPCKIVVHTVGPIWKHGTNNEDKDLASAVRAALIEADRRQHRSVSLPAISCGIYGFPVLQGSEIILREIRQFLDTSRSVQEVSIVSGKAIVSKFHDRLASIFGAAKMQRMDLSSSPDDQEEPMEVDDDLGGQSTVDGFEMVGVGGNSSHSDAASFRTREGITVRIVKGSIIHQQVDVIFCTSEKNLNLGAGAISKIVSQAAGTGLQDECRAAYPGGINFGEVVATGAHNLPMKRVYHGVCPRWDGGTGKTEGILSTLVTASLELAAKERMTSIALPSIGTGKLGIPHTVVAKTMFDAVKTFSSSAGGRSSLMDVCFVLYERDQQTINAFEAELASVSAANQPSARSFSGASPQKKNVEKLDCIVGDVKLQVKYGDITREKCDAIVNSTNEQHKLSVGMLSRAILAAAGDSIQQECDSAGWLCEGIAVTSGGKLPCKHIFHLYAKSDVTAWKSVIGRCFQEADKKSMTSLAMPPVGTGRASVGAAQSMAEAIFEEINSFAGSKPKHLKQICITVQHRGMVEEFVSVIEKAQRLAEQSSSKGVWARIKDFSKKYFSSDSSHQSQYSSSSHSAGNNLNKARQRGTPVMHQPTSTQKLDLCIYGTSYQAIEAASDSIRQMCKELEKVTILKNKDVQNYVPQLTAEQERKMKSLEQRHDVKITVVKGPSGSDKSEIRLEGSPDGISSAVTEIFEMLMEIKDHEKNEREIELLSKQAIWQYSDGQTTKQFDQRTTGLLEKAYSENKPTLDWKDSNGGQHAAVLTTGRMTYKDPSGNQFTLVRNTHDSIPFPSHWSAMTPGVEFMVVPVTPSTPEYNQVQQNLAATGQGSYRQIIRIERIQNPGLYRQYMTMKKIMDQRNPGVQNEKRLWHGTAGNNVQNINSRNFNRSYGGQHGLAIGNGVYFAVQSTYSIGGYCPADASGQKHIYQAMVLTGKTTAGQSGLKEPPAGFDSVSNGPNGMFVVFYDTQAYPEYHITFS